MTTHPLAILLVFRNNKDLAERILTTIYSKLQPGYSMYLVDDASDDETPRVIQSVVEHFGHDQTFFYENPTELGREKSIKELLQLIESPLIWMPEEVDERLSDLRLVSNLLRHEGDYPFEFDDADNRDNQNKNDGKVLNSEEITAKWINSIDLDGVEDIEKGGAGSWKRGADEVQSTQSNEHNEEEGAEIGEQGAEEELELGVSLEEVDFNEDVSADFDGLVGEVRPMGSSKREKLEKLGIDPVKAEQVSRPPQKSSKDTLKFRSSMRKNTVELSINASDVAQSVFPEVQQLVMEGENLQALRAIENAQLNHPSDVDLLKLKIKVLEFMRRFVEAAEIKHQLKMGGPGVAKPKVRKEAILIVDPAEDPGEAVYEERGAESSEQRVVAESTQNEVDSSIEEVGAESSESAEVQGTQEEEREDSTQLAGQAELGVSPKEYDLKPKISIVIPTTIDGKTLLERTLFSLSTKADKSDRELIIIDNASLDDTYEYLKQLKSDNFLQIRVITNPVNYGFARAVNQGIEVARGEYVLVMHNDVVLQNDAPGMLADIMDSYKDITTLGPLTEVTLNEDQRRKSVDPDPTVIKKTRYIDSFCMMLRKSKIRKFDERFGLAFFEDLDYCLEDTKQGGTVAIATGIKVDHLGGATTNVIGRESYSQAYWKNASEFEKKWDALPSPAPFTDEDSQIARLCIISELLNPFYPEPHLLKMAEEMITSELRNEILERKYNSNTQVTLIRLMLALDMRDVARVLEDSLDSKELDQSLLQLLTEFYFQKHIYSRCLKYLQMNQGKRKPFSFKLLELKVYMGTRDYDKATELLGDLIHEMPTHPELFKISSDIHKARGSNSEAEEFYSLAHQTDPVTFK